MVANRQLELITGKGLKRIYLRGPSKLQLYNLDEDPKELNDIAFKYPEIVSRMEDFMKEAHTTPKMDKFKIPVLDNK